MISNFNPSLKAELKDDIVFMSGDEEITLPAGTKSDILIKNNDGSYHFEALNYAVTVASDELKF